MKLRDLGEFGLIEKLRARLKIRGGVQFGIGDDAAVLESLHTPLVTTDCLVESVHFRRDWTSARSLGGKAIAVNVSDITAMGGTPVAALVSLALGARDDLAFVEELYRGLEEACELYGLTLCGGDTSRSPDALFINVTLVGEGASTRAPLLRNGAQSGDAILVTGTLGDSAAGLAILQSEEVSSREDSKNAASTRDTTLLPVATRDYLLQRHFEPTARLREINAALKIAPHAIHAALDLSDGIAGDAAHIAKASNVSLRIETTLLPISKECRAAARVLAIDATTWALSGGEDYELLLCVAPESAEEVAHTITQKTGTRATILGICVEDENPRVVLIDASGKENAAGSAFTHF
jgi:thiamine-monophosphate kinase